MTRANVAVEVYRQGQEPVENAGSLVLDLSDSGARLVVSCPFAPDERVDIVLASYALPRPIQAAATVCWCAPMPEENAWSIGVRFDTRLRYRQISSMFGR